MTTREKIRLTQSLRRLPRPLSLDASGFTYDTWVGPAVGISSDVLWRTRSVFHKACEEIPDPGDEALLARRTFALMCEAIESKSPNIPLSAVIRDLHHMNKQGECPNSLAVILGRVSQRRPPVRMAAIIPQGGVRPSPLRATEFRRAVDNLAGASIGLEALADMVVAGPPVGDMAYEARSLRRTMQQLRRVMRKVEEAL